MITARESRRRNRKASEKVVKSIKKLKTHIHSGASLKLSVRKVNLQPEKTERPKQKQTTLFESIKRKGVEKDDTKSSARRLRKHSEGRRF